MQRVKGGFKVLAPVRSPSLEQVSLQLLDSFAAVGWARPELYLNSDIRNGISSFANIADNQLNQGLANLYKDLETGVWDRKHGHLRQQEQYDVGYRFVYTAA